MAGRRAVTGAPPRTTGTKGQLTLPLKPVNAGFGINSLVKTSILSRKKEQYPRRLQQTHSVLSMLAMVATVSSRGHAGPSVLPGGAGALPTAQEPVSSPLQMTVCRGETLVRWEREPAGGWPS